MAYDLDCWSVVEDFSGIELAPTQKQEQSDLNKMDSENFASISVKYNNFEEKEESGNKAKIQQSKFSN